MEQVFLRFLANQGLVLTSHGAGFAISFGPKWPDTLARSTPGTTRSRLGQENSDRPADHARLEHYGAYLAQWQHLQHERD